MQIRKHILTAFGLLFAFIGVAGLLLPILPGYPFLIVAAILFARSSQRFYHWLLYNKIFGRQLRTTIQKRHVPTQTSLLLVGMLWVSVCCTIIFFAHAVWVRIVLVLTGISLTVLYVVVLHLLAIGNFKE